MSEAAGPWLSKVSLRGSAEGSDTSASTGHGRRILCAQAALSGAARTCEAPPRRAALWQAAARAYPYPYPYP